VDTETEGLDVVARYRVNTDVAGVFDFTAAGNTNDFRVTRTPIPQSGTLPTPPSLFARQARLRFEHGTPPWKVTLQADWARDAWGATLRSTIYGSVLGAGASEATDVRTGDQQVVDAELRYTFPFGLTAALGADNVLDEYPRQIAPTINTTAAAPFSSFSPFGFNGRFVYGRLAFRW